jgi:N utilization substance protein B
MGDPAEYSGGAQPAAEVSQSVIDSVIDADTLVEQIQVQAQPPLRSVAGGRHEARERAFHLLYEAEIKALPAQDVLDSQVLVPDSYTEKLVLGVEQHRVELTEVIDRLARGWSVSRMPTLDLALLRLGCFELKYCPEVPRGVILSEAVGLAGHYGTEDSSKFVNGLLTAAAEELRPT